MALAPQPALLESGREKLKQVKAHLNSQFVEREAVIESAAIALVGRFNLFFGGPPGTGKSQLATAITEAVENGRIFDIQMFRQTDAMELLGPWNPELLRQGRLVRVKEGFLQEALVAFIDEIDKGGAALDALLRPMNERSYREGREIIPMPLRTVISASNARLTDPTLAALMDRYHMRHWIGYVQDLDKFQQMLIHATEPRKPTPVQLTIEELNALQARSAEIVIDQSAILTLTKLRHTMKNTERIYSDRRWIQILKAAQTLVAIENDGDKVLPHHLHVALPFLTDRDNDSDVEKTLMQEIPASPMTTKGKKSVHDRLQEVKSMKNPNTRVEAFRSLLSEIQVSLVGNNDESLKALKLTIIEELNASMQGIKGGAR